MPYRGLGKGALQPRRVRCELWKTQLAKLGNLALGRVPSSPGYLPRGNSGRENSVPRHETATRETDPVFALMGNNLKTAHSTGSCNDFEQ